MSFPEPVLVFCSLRCCCRGSCSTSSTSIATTWRATVAGRCFDTESGVSPSHEWKCASTARDTFRTRAREALGLVASKTTKNVRNHGPWHQIKENHLQGASGRSPPPRVWRKQPKRLRVPFSTLKSIVNIPDTRKPVLNPETSWNPRHTCCSRGSKQMS